MTTNELYEFFFSNEFEENICPLRFFRNFPRKAQYFILKDMTNVYYLNIHSALDLLEDNPNKGTPIENKKIKKLITL